MSTVNRSMAIAPRSIPALALALLLALAGCGGGGSAGSSSGGDTGPTRPEPGPVPVGERIEPLDTAGLPPATKALRRVAAASRLPAEVRVPRVELDPLVELKRAEAPDDAGAPLRIGLARDVAATADADRFGGLLEWTALPDGSHVAALAFVASGARALRLGVRVEAVPPGAVLRFYGAPGSPVLALDAAALASLRALNEQAGLDADAATMAWGPDTEGPVGTLELELPPGVRPDELRLAVPQLSHLTQTVAEAVATKDRRDIGLAGACNVDVMCTAHEAESRAVAKILFTRGGISFLCSGTLMNDTRDSRTPYLLTASHCVSQQADASNLVSYWFFRAAACGASPEVDNAMVRVDGGARLLVTDAAADSSLLLLNQPAPPNVLYAGSYFGGGVGIGAEVLGIHHPQGDLQKASTGRILGYANCPTTDGPCQSSDATRGAMFRVGWRQGTTEAGSSGSALFAELDGTQYVVGALHGGNASCANPLGSDFYGRFQRAFAAGLRDWLAP